MGVVLRPTTTTGRLQVGADYNGWNDAPEDEREEMDAFEDLGKYDAFEGWPEDTVGPEYWLNKGLNRRIDRED
jgi:hypothetical protein